MNEIIAQLFAARDAAHILHLSTRSFAAHMALGDLYDGLVDLVDSLAEMHQGKYGILNIRHDGEGGFNTDNALVFIQQLSSWAESAKSDIPQDSFIQNEWDNVMSAIYKAKYKLENLS